MVMLNFSNLSLLKVVAEVCSPEPNPLSRVRLLLFSFDD